jgi:hypothetical protein
LPAAAFIPCPTVYPSRKIWEAGNTTDQPSRIEHNVPCGGHLRQCDICGELRYCGREGRCLDANQPSHYVRRRFNIDGIYGDGIIGWTRGDRWDGWQSPYFEKAEALQVLAYNNEPPVGKAWYDEETDAMFVHWENDGDEPQKFEVESIETPEGWKQVYAIGAGAWCWDADPVDLSA